MGEGELSRKSIESRLDERRLRTTRGPHLPDTFSAKRLRSLGIMRRPRVGLPPTLEPL
jgi:hypothetical protein